MPARKPKKKKPFALVEKPAKKGLSDKNLEISIKTFENKLRDPSASAKEKDEIGKLLAKSRRELEKRKGFSRK